MAFMKSHSLMKYFITIILILVIGGVTLFISVGDELGDVWNTLLSVKPGYLAVALLLMVGYYVIDGYIMQVVSREYNSQYSLKQGFVNNIVGILFSDLTPSATGGQFAQVYVFRNQGIAPARASGILVMCLISYQIVIVVYAAICMLLNPGLIFSDAATWIIAAVGFAVNIGVTAVLFVGSRSKKLQNFLINKCIRGLAGIHIIKNYKKTAMGVRGVFTEFREESITLFSKKKLFIITLVCNALKLTLLYSVPFFAVLAVGGQITVSQFPNFLILASAITMFNTFMPIPGASGGSEGSYLLLYGFLGRSIASSSMLVWRVITFYFGLILGFVVLIVSRDARGYRGQAQDDSADDSEELEETEETRPAWSEHLPREDAEEKPIGADHTHSID